MRKLFPLSWWAAHLVAALCGVAYIIFARYDWPGHAVIAVLAVYFAALSLVSGGWGKSK